MNTAVLRSGGFAAPSSSPVSGSSPVHHVGPALIALEDRDAWQALDRKPFTFAHHLQGHPLFELPRLGRLAEHAAVSADISRYFAGEDRHLDESERKRRLRASVMEVGSNGRWVALHFADRLDPDYAELLQQLLSGMEQASGVPIREQMTWASMTVFLNSPGLAVPYHFDHETNFLMQVEGEKEVLLYPNDPSVLTEREIEDFYRHNPVAGRYRAEVERAATAYRLTPGVGVHHPPLWPHRINNGDKVSISLALYYTMPDTEYRAHVHQVNYCLRMLGMTPRPPGQSATVDRIKHRLMRTLSTSRPLTHDQMLYSGIERLSTPLRLARQLAGRLAR